MSLDHEPLGEMGARGRCKKPFLVAMAHRAITGRSVAGEFCDGVASPFSFSVMDLYRCACGITACRRLSQVNATAGPISSPA